MVHAVPPKYMGYVFHAREQVATMDRTGHDQRHHQSPQSCGCGCVCVMLGGNLGWLTSDGLTG